MFDILEQKSEFFKILDLPNQPVKYKLWSDGKSLVMENHRWPMSLYETEFFFLKDLVIRYNLKNGYEVATGFGVSAIGAGLGFKENKGKLVTIDSYVEEKSENYFIYRDREPVSYENTDGWKSVNFLIKSFGLDDIITPKVGWSPYDIPTILSEYTQEKFDYAFIDGGHFPEQIIKDTEVILPYLADKCIVVYHDTFPDYFTEEVMNYIELKLGKRPTIALPEPHGLNISTVIRK
jgi:predicted O-methyltransferase YrrM